MDPLVRSLWLARAWTSGGVLVPAVAAAMAEPCWPTFLALTVALVVVAVAVVATLRFGRAFAAGDDGEILMRAGSRLPYAAFATLHAADRAELVASFLVAGLVGLGPPLIGLSGPFFALLLCGFGVVLNLLVWRQRRLSWSLLQGLWAYLHYDLVGTERALEPALRSMLPMFRAAAGGLMWQVRLSRGERDAVLRETEAAWSGTLDDQAATLGILRVGTGDAVLLERWLAASRSPSTRYERHLASLCRAHLALYRREWDVALAATREPIDLPSSYQRQLRLLEVAALQGAGRTDEARAVLGQVSPGLEVEAWRGRAQPAVWGLLEDAAAGRPTVALRSSVPVAPVTLESVVDHPFAPPVTPSVPRPARRRGAGAIPLEGTVLAAGRGPGRTALLTVLSIVLLVLCPVLLALVLLIRVLGTVDEWIVAISSLLAPFGLAVAVLVLADVALARHTAREAPVVVLSDERKIPRRWFTAWSFAGNLRLLGLTVVVFSVFALAEGIDARTPWTWILGLPFGLLMLYATYRRWLTGHLVAALHFLPPDEAVRAAERSRAATGLGRGWLALARLWAGDADGAERAAHEAALLQPELAWIEGWLRAGRGEVDLQRILGEPDPELLGDRYRRAVLVAVTALQAGASARVADRIDDWTDVAERLPNRYGALLVRLIAGVRRANGQAVGAEAANPDTDWVSRVWPFVP